MFKGKLDSCVKSKIKPVAKVTGVKTESKKHRAHNHTAFICISASSLFIASNVTISIYSPVREPYSKQNTS